MIPNEFISPLDETISIHYVLSDQELIDASIIILEEDSRPHLEESDNEEAGGIAIPWEREEGLTLQRAMGFLEEGVAELMELQAIGSQSKTPIT